VRVGQLPEVVGGRGYDRRVAGGRRRSKYTDADLIHALESSRTMREILSALGSCLAEATTKP
jgi:hypothetical protein